MEQTINLQVLTQVAEIELIYKSKVKASARPVIQKSKDAYDILIANWDENKIELQEQFKVLYLNRANKVLGIYDLSTGGVTGTVADPKLVLVTALKLNATGFILSHNHPSGNLQPSRQDLELTNKIKEAAKFLDMNLTDHLIVTNEKYLSMADEGLI